MLVHAFNLSTGRQRQVNLCEFEAGLVHRENSGPAQGCTEKQNQLSLYSSIEQLLPAKDKDDLSEEERRPAADGASTAGWAGKPRSRGAAEAGEHPYRPGAEQGEAGATHPGRAGLAGAGSGCYGWIDFRSPASACVHFCC